MTQIATGRGRQTAGSCQPRQIRPGSIRPDPQNSVARIEIEGGPSIWQALAVTPGARSSRCRDALTNAKHGQPISVKREFKQSLNVRKLADAKQPYFALRNELEVTFQTIRSAYSREPVVATEQNLVALSEVYFKQIEVNAERNATELLGDPEAQERAQQNTLADIAAIRNGDTSALGSYQRQAKALLIEHGFDVSQDALNTLTSMLMRQAIKSEQQSLDRYNGKFLADLAPSASVSKPS